MIFSTQIELLLPSTDGITNFITFRMEKKIEQVHTSLAKYAMDLEQGYIYVGTPFQKFSEPGSSWNGVPKLSSRHRYKTSPSPTEF
jgi:hypothetical protein